MELRVENSQFAPNHGGGGGNFYQGRQQQDEHEKDDEKDEAKGTSSGTRLERDSCSLPETRRSTLGLVLPPVRAVVNEAPADLEGLDDEIHRSLRVMTLMMIRLERDFERRLRVEVGDVVIGA